MFSAVTTRQKFLLPRSSDGSRRAMSRQTKAVAITMTDQRGDDELRSSRASGGHLSTLPQPLGQVHLSRGQRPV